MQTEKQLFYKLTTPFALLMGGCLAIASYICFLNTGHIFNNPVLDRTLNFLLIIGLFMRIRQYRDSDARQGYITYGKALLTGIWLSFIAGLVYSLYTIILYSSHPELITSYLNIMQDMIKQIYGEHALNDMMAQIITTFTTPFSIGLSELFGKFIHGLIFSLIIAVFIRKQPIKLI
ncbi:DUF4199 domain-containing protein [Odoribacter lunatus]|uniref:DUF4199 domain-containing protein n=1 Tax=Odoribacter lunatus TaxID=2941335 RepID=UPI00203C9C1E|nr:DUF4199 domain-containing protein [Odoribacter lunatus]